ncbi:oligosaccharide flippase family protein [Alteromonas sp. B31-7]|uniref:oligosaccharide flippase family protein n=1 Tax=Alteromonas sp. B31-7 TaxID=2785913 RepID=UPI0018C99B98|nr:oligosaccharide flippase family protein [Alteromonas sp. B31-7]QPL51148.1 oligosaccharide flippase family protein [Alteromonas sp. B31-7]
MIFFDIAKSSGIITALNLIKRFLSVFSLIVLARLLDPYDFGVAAILTIVLFIFEKIASTGALQYILQLDKVDDVDLNSSWSLDFLIKGSLFIVLVACSEFLAHFYGDPSIRLAFIVVSFNLIVKSLNNPGIHLQKKSFNYKSIFYIGIIQKLSSTAVCISIAYFYQSYWALIIADLLSNVIMMLGTYYFCSYRPKFDFTNVAKQWTFSKWIMLKSMVSAVKGQIDAIWISKLFPVESLGFFHVARNLSMMASQEVINPAMEPLISAFSKVGHKKNDEFIDKFCVTLFALAFIIIPLSFGIALFSVPLVQLVLGDGWEVTGELMQVMSLFVFSFSMMIFFSNIIISKGVSKPIFIIDSMSFFLTVITFLILSFEPVLSDFVLARSIISLFTLCLAIGFSCRVANIDFKCIFLSVSPILASVSFATLTMFFIESYFSLHVIFSVAIFMACYFMYLVVMYLSFFNRFHFFNKIFKRLEVYYFAWKN